MSELILPSNDIRAKDAPARSGLFTEPKPGQYPTFTAPQMMTISAPDSVKPYEPVIQWMRELHLCQPLTNGANMLRVNILDVEHHWYEWNFNTIHNVNLQLPALHEFFRRKNSVIPTENQDKRVLVVAAGPSTKDELNTAYLRKNKDLFDYIICVDRAFKPLKEAGIDPDLIITEDASDRVYDFLFAGNPMPDKEKTKLAFCAFAGHRAAKAAKDMGYDCYLYGSANPYSPFWLTFMNTYGKEYIGPRCGCIVTFSAIDVAYWMGYGTIVCLGNDLAYKDPWEAQADCPYGFTIIALNKPKTIHYTIEAFRMAYDQLQSFANAVKIEVKPPIRMIDCISSFSPPKENWENIPFRKLKSALLNGDAVENTESVITSEVK